MSPPPVRPATGADEPAVLALWRACALVVPYNDPAADFRRARAGPASDVLLAAAAGHVLGTIMVGHDGHRGWLYYLAVDPDRRRTGLGRALVRGAETWLRDRGIPRLQLMVRDTNPAVIPFYERLGFAVIPRTVMARRLD